jgi:hypothetical protein
MKPPTIEDCICLIREYHILDDWPDSKLAAGILSAINQSAFSFTVDNTGHIDGLVYGRWITPCEHIFITLAIGKGKLRRFFKHLHQLFPQCRKISCIRDGVEKTYTI